MMPDEVLSWVTEKLEHCGIPYMIAGSFASNMHGLPRTTHDADLIVEIEASSIDKLSQALGEDFYFDASAAKEAKSLGVISNIIHYESGFKVDLILRKNRPFSREEFQRRQLQLLAGKNCWFATAEDTIIAKLEWSKMGKSERQFSDAVTVAKVQINNLDMDYLRRWAVDLQVEDLLNRLLNEVKGAD
jgi:hypothetical protein